MCAIYKINSLYLHCLQTRNNMHLFFRISLILVVSLLLITCKDTPAILIKAERLMETAPDSALQLLKTTQVENFYLPSDKALYALLYCQALDKNGIPFELDSLISIATDYYDSSQPERATNAWYYSSRCSFYRNDNEAQARDLLKANEYAQNITDLKIKALIYTNKAELHEKQKQNDSSLLYYNKAAEIFLKLNDNRNIVICYLHIGTVLAQQRNLKDAKVIFTKADKIAIDIKDTLLISTIYRSVSSLYRRQGDLEKAKKYLLATPTTNSKIYNYNTYYLLAKVLLQQKKNDSAYIFLNKIDTVMFYYPDFFELWKDYYFQKGNLLNALRYSEKVSICKDSINSKSLKESFAGLEKKFNYQELKLSNSVLKLKNSQKSILILVILLLLSAIIIGFLYWRNIIKQKQLKTEKALFQQEKLRSEKEHENLILLEKQLKLQKIVVANLDQYRKNALKQPDKIKAGFSPIENTDFNEELIIAIDLEYDNLTKRLTNKYLNLSSNDILICCLLLSNFDTGMISSILGIKSASMNIKRSRLRKKLGIDNSVNLLEFLHGF